MNWILFRSDHVHIRIVSLTFPPVLSKQMIIQFPAFTFSIKK